MPSDFDRWFAKFGKQEDLKSEFEIAEIEDAWGGEWTVGNTVDLKLTPYKITPTNDYQKLHMTAKADVFIEKCTEELVGKLFGYPVQQASLNLRPTNEVLKEFYKDRKNMLHILSIKDDKYLLNKLIQNQYKESLQQCIEKTNLFDCESIKHRYGQTFIDQQIFYEFPELAQVFQSQIFINNTNYNVLENGTCFLGYCPEYDELDEYCLLKYPSYRWIFDADNSNWIVIRTDDEQRF